MSRARELAKVGGLQQTISGVSTHVGISTFASDVYILGKLDITGDLGFDEMTAVNSKITGISTSVDTIISRNLSVAGLSTFSGLVKVDGAAIEAASAKIGDLTNNRIIIAGTAGELEDDANLTFDSAVLTVTGSTSTTVRSTTLDLDVTRNVEVAGITTFTGAIDANGALDVDGQTDLDVLNVSDVSTFTGAITANGGVVGDLTGAATQITLADESSDTSCNVVFATGATGNLAPKTGTNLTFNSSSGALTATSFVGALTGNVTGDVTGDVTGALTGAATQITLADESSDTTCFPVFATGATGDLAPKTGDNLTFNSSSGALTATSFVGALTGNVTGNASGSSGSCTGNAATATALETARNIGGVSFDGTANITLPGVNSSGNQDTSGTAALATTVTVTANNSTDETVYPVFVDGATGTQGAETDTGLSYNPSSGALTATTFTGALTGAVTGNVTGNISGNQSGGTVSATSAAIADLTAQRVVVAGTSGELEDNSNLTFNGSLLNIVGDVTASGTITGDVTGDLTGNVVGNVTGAASKITVADESTDTTCFPVFVDAATGHRSPFTGSNLTFNSNDGTLGATNLTLTGNLTVQGSTTTVESTTLTVADKNIVVGQGSANDAAADGSGITVDSGDGDKTWNWVDATDSWTSSEHIDLANGKVLKHNTATILSETTLGSSVVASSLTSVGTIASGTWQGTAINDTYIGTINNADKVALSALDIDGGSDISAALVDADLLIVDDGAGGTNRKFAASRIKTYVGAEAGAFTLANLDIDGGTDIGAGLADADLFIIDDGAGGTNRKTAASRIKTYIADVTLTTAAQTAITSVGTLSSLNVSGALDVDGATTLDGLTVAEAAQFDAAITASGGVVGNVTGDVTGDLTGAATRVTVTASSDTTSFLLFAQGATGDLTPHAQTNLTFNATSGALTATSFVGALTGNVTGNTSGSSGSCTGTAAVATDVTASANNSTDESVYLTFVDGATGTQGIETDTGLSYNPSSGTITTTAIGAHSVTGTLTTQAIIPDGNGTRDLGASGTRFANIYSSDVDLSNEARGGNTVDGSWGSYLIEEGENDLFLKNRRTGKQYKFCLQEV